MNIECKDICFMLHSVFKNPSFYSIYSDNDFREKKSKTSLHNYIFYESSLQTFFFIMIIKGLCVI